MDLSREIRDAAYRALVDGLAEGVALAISSPWRVSYVNQQLSSWMGVPAAGSEPGGLDSLFSSDCLERVIWQLDDFWQGNESTATFSASALRQGISHPVEVRASRLQADGQSLLGMVITDQPEVRRSTDVHASRTDPLTGLADRTFLFNRLANLLRGERSADRHFAVLFLDLDNFKQVNDSYGHLVGDRVLREVGRRLSQCVRGNDHVVRFGGDEFVVLIEQVADAREIDPIIVRIHDVLAKPIALPEGEVMLAVSIGVAEALAEHQTPEDVLGAADRHMYAAKRLNA